MDCKENSSSDDKFAEYWKQLQIELNVIVEGYEQMRQRIGTFQLRMAELEKLRLDIVQEKEQKKALALRLDAESQTESNAPVLEPEATRSDDVDMSDVKDKPIAEQRQTTSEETENYLNSEKNLEANESQIVCKDVNIGDKNMENIAMSSTMLDNDESAFQTAIGIDHISYTLSCLFLFFQDNFLQDLPFSLLISYQELKNHIFIEKFLFKFQIF